MRIFFVSSWHFSNNVLFFLGRLNCLRTVGVNFLFDFSIFSEIKIHCFFLAKGNSLISFSSAKTEFASWNKHFNLFVDLQKTTSDELAYRWVYSNESNRKEKETNLKLKLKQHLLNNGNIWELVPALCHWRALVVKEIKFWTKNATKHRNARIENKSSKADYAFAATAKKPDSRISTERTRSHFQPILCAYISGTSNLFSFIWIAWKMWLHSAYTYVHRVIWLRSDHFKFFSFEKHDFEIAAAQ